MLYHLIIAINRYNVEPEFLCVVQSSIAEPPIVELLSKRGFHVELVEAAGGFSSTVIEAFNIAHYSLLLVSVSMHTHTHTHTHIHTPHHTRCIHHLAFIPIVVVHVFLCPISKGTR